MSTAQETIIYGGWLLVPVIVVLSLAPPVTLSLAAGYVVGFLSAAYFIHRRRVPFRIADMPPVPADMRRERLPSTIARLAYAPVSFAVVLACATVWLPLFAVGAAYIAGLLAWACARVFYLAWRTRRDERSAHAVILSALAREWAPRQTERIFFRTVGPAEVPEAGPAVASGRAPFPKGAVCALCGVSLEGFVDVRQSGRFWFCCQGHFLAYEGRPAPAARSATRRALEQIVPVAAFAGLLVFAIAAHSGSTRGGLSTQEEAQALSQGLKAVLDPGPPKRLTVHLDTAALAVAGRFVHAEYVSHKCSEQKGIVPPDIIGVPTTLDCSDEVRLALKYNDHLVRGSRVLVHGCPAATLGPGIESNECLHYTLIGRNRLVESIDGKPVPGCDVSVTVVYPEKQRGRWQVVGETSWSDRGGDCLPGDAKLWRRRIPYAKS